MIRPPRPSDQTPRDRLKVFLVASVLNTGGTQTQMVALAIGLHQSGVPTAMVVFHPGGALVERLQAAGVPVHPLHKQGGWRYPAFLFRLIRLMWRERPTVLYTCLGFPNLLCAGLRPWFPSPCRLVWGMRTSRLDWRLYGRRAAFESWLERRLSRLPDRIICNSWSGKEHALANGYPAQRLVVVPNGIDTDRFRPDPEAGSHLRARWGIPPTAFLIGLVARIDLIKDHETFLRAAARLTEPAIHFVCIGDGDTPERHRLDRLASELGLNGRMRFTGEVEEMPSAYNALDLAVNASRSEGSPNTVGEAMACGKPCVVTRVGDSPLLVAMTGRVVPPQDPEAMAHALRELFLLSPAERAALGDAARERITGQFSLPQLIFRTRIILDATLLAEPAPPG